MIFFSISVTVVSMLYRIIPCAIIYGLYSILISFSLIKKEFDFKLENISWLSRVFGMFGIIMGFWYFHWVENPIILNAIIFYPLGITTCPTMLVICGILIFNSNTKLYLLEFVVGLTTLWFGFMGFFTLGAYADITLIIIFLFILIRIGYNISLNNKFVE